MENLRIKSTVQPDKKLDYNQWCRKYGVGRQYYKDTTGTFSLHDYNFSAVEKQHPIQNLLNKILQFFAIS